MNLTNINITITATSQHLHVKIFTAVFKKISIHMKKVNVYLLNNFK